jgi:DNA-binding MarR family transcriptional regulator
MARSRKEADVDFTHPDCDPDTCPCDDGACSLSRYVRATAEARGDGQHTLLETERQVAARLSGMNIDMDAMAAVSNVYRAANAVRNHLERTVLAPHDLTWTGWVVLWVVWIWGDLETRHVASEAGISKGTLTGVMSTLENRGLVKRRAHPDDARRVLLALTPKGKKLMTTLFPLFNAEEAFVTSGLSSAETTTIARALRKVVHKAEA